MEVELTIEYVNARQDRRPASIKGNNGAYYTLSDAAYTELLPWKGHSGLLSYYENDKGFNIATHWNGVELPKDANVRRAAARPVPMGGQHTIAPPVHPHPSPSIPGLSQKAEFGYVMVDGMAQRTMPTVREQFIMKVVESTIGRAENDWATDRLIDIVQAAKSAWAQTIDMPKDPPEPANMPSRFPAPRDTDTREGMAPGPGYSDGLPPAMSPEDYLGGG